MFGLRLQAATMVWHGQHGAVLPKEAVHLVELHRICAGFFIAWGQPHWPWWRGNHVFSLLDVVTFGKWNCPTASRIVCLVWRAWFLSLQTPWPFPGTLPGHHLHPVVATTRWFSAVISVVCFSLLSLDMDKAAAYHGKSLRYVQLRRDLSSMWRTASIIPFMGVKSAACWSRCHSLSCLDRKVGSLYSWSW